MGIRERVRKLFGGRKKEKKPDVRPEATDVVRVIREAGKPVPYACGHPFAPRFEIDCYGQELSLADEAVAKREKCGPCALEEFKRVVIRCGACGFAILPGDGVALYVDDRKTFPKRERVTLHEKQVVGCLRMDCCPSGGFYAGNWDGTKFVPAFPGGMSAAATAMATGKAVVGNTDGNVTLIDVDKPEK